MSRWHRRLVVVAAASLGLPLAVTATPLTYDVNLTGGGETITGTISTDGTLGSITLADITSWSFVVTGSPLVFSINSTDSSAVSQCAVGPCAFGATPTTLTFDFGLPQLIAFDAGHGPVIDAVIFNGTSPQFSPNAEIDVVSLLPPVHLTVVTVASFTGEAIVGRVPEPATLALLGIGLAGLGISHRRKLN